MYLTTQGLVLRSVIYNDTDELLTILTADHGLLTVKARGIRRKNSPLAAPCQLLALAEFVLFENRGRYTINEVRSVELFTKLRTNLLYLSLSAYIVQVAEVLAQEDLPSPELLSLVLNCLYALAHLSLSVDKVKAVFELRSACLAGYMPDLRGCHSCGCADAELFNVTQGCLECAACAGGADSGLRLPVTAGMLKAMRFISSCESKRIFAFRLRDCTMEELSHVTECYLTTQLERGFSSLDYYKSLQNPNCVLED